MAHTSTWAKAAASLCRMPPAGLLEAEWSQTAGGWRVAGEARSIGALSDDEAESPGRVKALLRSTVPNTPPHGFGLDSERLFQLAVD
ncbi:hypothetical protein ACWGGS_19335 [Streptomyces decoyicus]